MLPCPNYPTRTETLRSLGYRLLALADDCAMPSRSLDRANRLIEEGETIAAAVRRQFR